MNNKNKEQIDLEIQEALEKQQGAFDPEQFASQEDAELYKVLFEKLEQPPQIDLGIEFAETVVAVAHQRKRRRELILKILLYIGISVPMFALCMIIVLAMNADVFWKMAGALKNTAGFILFGFALVAAIQFLDKILVKNKMPDMRIKKKPC